MNKTVILPNLITNLSSMSPPYQDLGEEDINPVEKLGFIFMLGLLLLALAIGVCVSTILEGCSSQNLQNRRVHFQVPRVHRVPNYNMYMATGTIQPTRARGVLPDYQTIARMDEEALPTYSEAVSAGDDKFYEAD
eukprot:GFUD01060826.1.p1 GENE.GFUD01060826.1~~GFUD01060826.1.p1  ORF type:complete len:135 (+),score=11.07 GFUD01060826.1:42-446(+)